MYFKKNHQCENCIIPCPYCSSPKGFIYVQSHYQCLTCKRVVDDCCGGETVQCIVPVMTSKELEIK